MKKIIEGVYKVAVVNPYNYVKPASVVARGAEFKRPQKTKNNQKSKQDAYLTQKIMSAKPEELTLMLYEGLVKFIKLSEYYVQKKNYEKTNENAKRAEDIVAELKITLNKDYEISNELDRLYTFIEDELLEANFKKDIQHFINAREIAEELTETWRAII